jgi:ribosome-associated protein
MTGTARRVGTAEPLDLAVAAARAAEDKGATDILVIDVGDVLGICSYFVVASASNPRQVKAVADEVEDRLREEHGAKPRSVEGAAERRWVLLDYADIVVHVFHRDEREFYRIERLYADAPKVDWGPSDPEPDGTDRDGGPDRDGTVDSR